MNIVFGDKAIEIRRFHDGADCVASCSSEHVCIDISGDYPDDEKHFVVFLKNT